MSVLVAYDGSDPAKKALEHAFANHADERITVVYVTNPVDPATADEIMFPEMDDYREQATAQGQELLDSIKKKPEAEGLDVETEMLVGAPERELVAYAEDNDIDHIIIGSHGRSGVSRILLGSVAELVVRRSPVPVTVVR